MIPHQDFYSVNYKERKAAPFPRTLDQFQGRRKWHLKLAYQSSPTISKQILKVVSGLFRTAETSMLLQRKPSEALVTCLETITRWLPLKRGPELIILASGNQCVKTVEIPSRNRFRFFIYFALLQDVSSTLQCIKKKEKKEGQIT